MAVPLRAPRAEATGWRAPARQLTLFVWLVALHSVGVGVVMFAATDWAVGFGGWPPATPAFFVRQFGVFHFAVAAAYLIEHHRYGGVSIMLAAKAIAVASLLLATVRDGGPWAVPFAAAGDAAMAALAWWLHRRAHEGR